jgi:condensation domain-containing protein
VGLFLERTDRAQSRATVAQECFWYMRRSDPDPSSYVMGLRLALSGPLDVGALAGAVESAIARHSVFRTALRELDGRLHQFVLGDLPRFELEREDRSGTATADRPDLVARLERELGATSDLASGRTVRGRLVTFAPDVHALVLTVDHAMADAASLFMLQREIQRAYTHGSAGTDEPPWQFIDYASSLERFARSPAGGEWRSWWRNHLAGVRPNVLPIDHPRTEHDARRAAAPYGIISGPMLPTLSVEVPSATRERMTRVAGEHGVPASVLYLAAYAWWLREATGEDEVCIENLHNPRGDHHVEKLQGAVVTWTIVRARIAECASLRDAIQPVQDALAAAVAHTPVPDYYDIVPAEIRGVTFNYMPLSWGNRPTKCRDVTIEQQPRGFPRYHRHWELMLFVTDSTQRGYVNFTGNAALFRPETVDALAHRYVQILAELE